MTTGLVLIASVSVIGMYQFYLHGPFGMRDPYWFIADSNKLLSLAIGLTSFMWVKGLKIPYSRFINVIGATTFGVLLIHANSDAMRRWLWRETVDTVGHFGNSLALTLGYAAVFVLIIFIVCSGIDWFRSRYVEPHLLKLAEKFITHLKAKFELRFSKQDQPYPQHSSNITVAFTDE